MGSNPTLPTIRGDNMPKAFTDCVKNGGKVITKKLPKKKYMHICYDKNGKSHPGEVMTKKSSAEVLEDVQNILRKVRTGA